jgi:hypothetical protein
MCRYARQYYDILTNMNKYLLLMCSVVLFAGVAHADPVVTNFSISPTSINNGYNISVTWNIESSAGGDLMFICQTGIYITTEAGSVVTCDTRIALSGAQGSLGYKVVNVSGSTRTLVARLYPKDQNSVAFDSLSTQSSVTVTTAAQPILNFTAASTTISSGGTQTLTWQGLDAPGTMLTFSCNDAVRLYRDSTSAIALPCNTEVQTTDLPITGTFTFVPKNTSPTTHSIGVTLRPAIATNMYDAGHAQSLSFSVAGTPPVAEPAITSFSGSASVLESTTTLALSWSSISTYATALQIACTPGITLYVSSSTDALPCNNPLPFSFTSTGSTTLTVKNTNPGTFPIQITLMPQTQSGSYLAQYGKTVSVPIPKTGTVVPPPQLIPFTPGTTTPTVGTSTKTIAPAISTKTPFTRFLKRGMKTPDVLRLQAFLALNPQLYPEASVTGVFGPATERAVQRFQEKYGIAKKGVEGYGTVGHGTRAKLNALVTP